MDVVTLGQAKAQGDRSYGKVPSANVGTRIIDGRFYNTVNLGSNSTFQQAFEVAQHYDAVRPIFAEVGTAFSGRALACKVSAPAAIGDGNNNTGTWTALTANGLGGPFMFPLSPSAARVALWTTDWTPIKSSARSDGGTRPLVMFRTQIASDVFLTSWGDGTDTFTNWASRTNGKFLSRVQTGDMVTDPTTLTTTTNVSYGPIVGVQYLARGKVITVMGVGDSITEGRGTYKGEGFIYPAVEALSDMTGVAVEYISAGWTGQTYAVFVERGLDFLESDFRPDILVLPSGSPNDESSTLTQAGVDKMAGYRGRLLAACAERQIVPVVWTWLPSNTAQRPYGSSDSLRVADNAAVIAQAAKDGKLLVADLATAFSGVTTGGQVQIAAGLTTDDIHPNDTGNTTLAAVLQPVLARAMKGALGGGVGGQRPKRAAWPVFVTRGAAVLTTPGTYVYAGTSTGTWQIGAIAPTGRATGSQRYTVVNRGTAVLTLSGLGSTFNVGGVTGQTSVPVNPGESGEIVNDGSSWWFMRHTSYSKRGTATLVAGTVTVADTSITTGSKIALRTTTLGGTPGALYVSAKTASTSFVITSTSGTDTSTVEWTVERY